MNDTTTPPESITKSPEELMREHFQREAEAVVRQIWQYHKSIIGPKGLDTISVIAAWMDTAARHCRNEQYYRDLLVRCGRAIGKEAFTCDDGSVVPDVLVAKIPELVEKLCLPELNTSLRNMAPPCCEPGNDKTLCEGAD